MDTALAFLGDHCHMAAPPAVVTLAFDPSLSSLVEQIFKMINNLASFEI
jgi:hypothetical protein